MASHTVKKQKTQRWTEVDRLGIHLGGKADWSQVMVRLGARGTGNGAFPALGLKPLVQAQVV